MALRGRGCRGRQYAATGLGITPTLAPGRATGGPPSPNTVAADAIAASRRHRSGGAWNRVKRWVGDKLRGVCRGRPAGPAAVQRRPAAIDYIVRLAAALERAAAGRARCGKAASTPVVPPVRLMSGCRSAVGSHGALGRPRAQAAIPYCPQLPPSTHTHPNHSQPLHNEGIHRFQSPQPNHHPFQPLTITQCVQPCCGAPAAVPGSPGHPFPAIGVDADADRRCGLERAGPDPRVVAAVRRSSQWWGQPTRGPAV